MSSVQACCLVVTWATSPATYFTLSMGHSGANPVGSCTVNSMLDSHVPQFLVVGLCFEKD